MESIASLVFAFAAGAGVMWWVNRPAKRQFMMMMEAIDTGKERDKDWKFVRDDSGNPTGFRLIYGASSPTDKAGSI